MGCSGCAVACCTGAGVLIGHTAKSARQYGHIEQNLPCMVADPICCLGGRQPDCLKLTAILQGLGGGSVGY